MLEPAMVKLSELRRLPRNTKDHDIGAINESYDEFGFLDRIIINKTTGHLLAGHGRIDLLQQLKSSGAKPPAGINPNGKDWFVPADYAEIPAEKEEKAAIALNRIQERGGHKDDLLAAVLSDYAAKDDLRGTGYDKDDLDQLLRDLGTKNEIVEVPAPIDKAAELQKKWKSERGQIWEIGRHRLMCGDCTDTAELSQLFHGKRAQLLWTDPPYGVSYVGKTKAALTIQNDGAKDLREFLISSFRSIECFLQSNSPFYIAHPPGVLCLTFGDAIRDVGWKFHQTLIWVKDSMVLGHSDYHFKHEPIYYGFLPGDGRPGRGNHKGSQWNGDHSQVSVFLFDRPKRSEEHPTMKPIGLIGLCVENSSRIDSIVADPFAGSGSTLVAAEQLSRICYGMEIEPKYVAVTPERLSTMGLKPKLL